MNKTAVVNEDACPIPWERPKYIYLTSSCWICSLLFLCKTVHTCVGFV